MARDAFITRCSGCHNLPSPKTHTKYEWKALLPEMLNDSKATENEKELITKFIISFSKIKMQMLTYYNDQGASGYFKFEFVTK